MSITDILLNIETGVLLHCVLASCGAVYCNRSCLWVGGWVGVFVGVCVGLLPR